MHQNTSAAKVRTAKPYSGQPNRKFAQPGAAYANDMYEKSKVGAEETNKVIEQTYSTIARSAADFNVQWIEMVRANINSALDYSRQLVGAKSPSEFLELSAAHARKQFEIFTEQAKQLTSLAQKVTTDAVQPLQAGVKSTLSRAA
jgi:phasin